MNLRCYCCGEKLGDRFVIGAHEFADNAENDRVFLFKEGHEKRADDIGITFKTEVIERRP